MKFITCFVVAVALYATVSSARIGLPVEKLLRNIPARNDYGTFTPASLPCAYNANYHMYVKMNDEDQVVDGYQAGYGDHSAIYEKGERSGAAVNFYSIFRADIKESGYPDSGAVVDGTSVMQKSVCEFEEYAEDVTQGHMWTNLLDFAIAQPFLYDTKKENVDFGGQKCTMYSIDQEFSATSSIYSELYANSDNYCVGFYLLRVDEGEKSNLNATISYKMTAYESQFMLDRTYQGCDGTNYSAIYSAPPKDPNCPIDPRPPSY